MHNHTIFAGTYLSVLLSSEDILATEMRLLVIMMVNQSTGSDVGEREWESEEGTSKCRGAGVN